MHKKAKAFTLVEVLISIALLALLMTSVAAAVHASLQSNAENAKLAAITQSARSVMNRISADVRTAAAVDTTSTTVTLIPPAGSGVDQICYEAADGKLYYRKTVGGTETFYVLVGDGGDGISVEYFIVTAQMGLDWQGLTCTKSVTAVLSLTDGRNRLSTTASAAPRRNQTY